MELLSIVFLFLIPPAIVFGIGYAVGYSAFKKSPKRVSYSVLSGVTAVVVTGAILFAGCIVLFSHADFK